MSHQCEVFNETGTCVHVEKRYIKVTVTDTYGVEQIEFWLAPGSVQFEILDDREFDSVYDPRSDQPFIRSQRQSLRLTGDLSLNEDGHYAKQTICDE